MMKKLRYELRKKCEARNQQNTREVGEIDKNMC